MTVIVGAQDMSIHDKSMVSWPLRSLVLTFQVIHLVLGTPFYTAAPKLSHGTDHIPATILLEELLVLESENRVKDQARKWAAVQAHRGSHAWLPKSLFTQLPRPRGSVWPREIHGHTLDSASPECNSSRAERPTPQPH